jgi:photosystem II stability/assembly factor-like uncharacterized protein
MIRITNPLPVLGVLLAVWLAAACGAGEKPSYLTVQEVSQRAESLAGKQIRVRGYGYFSVSMTVMLCIPSRCDCNQSAGWLELYGEQPDPQHLGRLWDIPSIRIADDSLKCQGDECSMKCSPFDPGLARQFDFVGRLKIDYGNLILENLDLAASRQLINASWVPIETGSFTVTRAALPTLAPATPAAAQAKAPANQWVRFGPDSAGIGSLVIDPLTPATLYAGTREGLYKSTDAGGTWQLLTTELITRELMNLVIDPRTPATLYAGMWNRGVFKSTDGGATWQATNTGLTSLYVTLLMVDPLNPAHLYIATDASIDITTGAPVGGLFKSTDGGASWQPAGRGLGDPYVSAMAFDPTPPGTLYAKTQGGLYKSTDAAASWQPIGNGLGDTIIYVIRTDPKTPTTLYAAGNGIFKSTDGGANWSKVGNGLPAGDKRVAMHGLVIDPQKPNVLYVGSRGVYKSTDGALNWKPAGKGLGEAVVGLLVMDPRDSTSLYAGTMGGDSYIIHKVR